MEESSGLLTTNVLVTLGALTIPVAYFLYHKFFQKPTYVSVNEDGKYWRRFDVFFWLKFDFTERLRSQMEAARLKQQEIYDKSVQEAMEKAKEKGDGKEEVEEEKPKSSKFNLDKPKNGSDYLPLMNHSPSYYRPPKKRPCGPCGGGGCG